MPQKLVAKKVKLGAEPETKNENRLIGRVAQERNDPCQSEKYYDQISSLEDPKEHGGYLFLGFGVGVVPDF